jgi:hypothetical protein
MGQVRFRHHRGHGGSNIFIDKFCPDMSVEYFAEVLHRGIFGHGNISPLNNCDKRPTDDRTHNRFDELATSHRAPRAWDKHILQAREIGSSSLCPLKADSGRSYSITSSARVSMVEFRFSARRVLCLFR